MWLINMLIQRRQALGRLKGLPKTGDRKRGSVDRGSVRFFDPKSCPQPDLLAMLKLS